MPVTETLSVAVAVSCSSLEESARGPGQDGLGRDAASPHAPCSLARVQARRGLLCCRPLNGHGSQAAACGLGRPSQCQAWCRWFPSQVSEPEPAGHRSAPSAARSSAGLHAYR